MCRIFDADLPVASHLTNFSSFAFGAQRLLKVNASYSNFTHQVVQCPSLLRNCKNLLSAIGFNNCSNIIQCNSMFYKDESLKYVDFALPNKIIDETSIHHCFGQCSGLTTDISYLFPTNGFYGKIDTTNIFRNCIALSGTVPADILWQNKYVEWNTSNRNMFLGCSTDIRSQVPVSWGGTNKNLENKLKIKDVNYYSAFEVYPTTEVILTGYCDALSANIIYAEIPAKTLQTLVLRTYITDKTKSDIVIDWGDGTYNTLQQSAAVTDIDKNNDDEINYVFNHDYKIQNKFIIKIYGKDYFGIKQSYIKEGSTTRT